MRNHSNKVYLDIIAGSSTLGRVEFELFYDITPKTAENFRGLCTGEYGNGKINKKKLTYKGSKIHKILEGQYIEGGDIIYGNGKGGESIYGEFFNDENFKRRHACAGLLSMSNKGRNTNSSQFKVTLKACPHLDDKNVVFGQVVSGMEVIRQISKIPTDTYQRPKVKILIFDCGDYDTRRLHWREDVFKDTIKWMLQDRANKEKVKILGEEEAEEYKKTLKKSAFDIEQEYAEVNEVNTNNNNSNNNDLNFEEDDDEEYEDNIERFKVNLDNTWGKNGRQWNPKIKEDLIKKYSLLNAKITEATNLNNKTVMEENSNWFTQDKEKRLKKQEWWKHNEEWKYKIKEQGVTDNKWYALNSINRCEDVKDKMEKKKKFELWLECVQ